MNNENQYECTAPPENPVGVFVLKGSPGCLVQDAIQSKECREYHRNSCLQINGDLVKVFKNDKIDK